MTPLPPPRQPGCPSDLDLERVLLPSGGAKARAHVEGCPHCQARVAWAKDVEQAFVAGPLVRTREAVVEKALSALPFTLSEGRRPESKGQRPRLLQFLIPAFAFAAVLLVAVFIPASPPPDYVGVKGSSDAVGLDVWLGVEGKGQRLASGALVHPGDGLRFSLQGAPRRVWLFTVDARGEISRLSPETGSAAPESDGVLPGGAVLDEVLGPERVFIVDAEAVPSFAEVEAAVRSTYGADATTIRSVPRLPLSAAQDSVLLEKVQR